jgi:uncharacterized protein YecT (DUF1311 family)
MKIGLNRWSIVVLIVGLMAGCFPSGSQSLGEQTSPQPSASVATPDTTASTPSGAGASPGVPASGNNSVPNSPGETTSSPNDQLIAQQPGCENPQTQSEINQCASKGASAADQQLNEVYQQLRTKLQSSDEQLLVDAQLAWIQFRDKDCAFSSSRFRGGSIAPGDYSSCVERHTKQRIQDLQNYLQGIGGT